MTEIAVTGIRSPFVRYDENGEITMWGVQDSGVTAYQRDELGEPVALGDGGPANYVLNGIIKSRGANPAELDWMTLRKLPKPSRIAISAPSEQPTIYTVTDGKADLSFEHPGTYRVEVTTYRHMPKAFEVTV